MISSTLFPDVEIEIEVIPTRVEMINRLLWGFIFLRKELFWHFEESDSMESVVRDVLERLCEVDDENVIQKACAWIGQNPTTRCQLTNILPDVLREVWTMTEKDALQFIAVTKRFEYERSLNLLSDSVLYSKITGKSDSETFNTK